MRRQLSPGNALGCMTHAISVVDFELRTDIDLLELGISSCESLRTLGTTQDLRQRISSYARRLRKLKVRVGNPPPDTVRAGMAVRIDDLTRRLLVLRLRL